MIRAERGNVRTAKIDCTGNANKNSNDGSSTNIYNYTNDSGHKISDDSNEDDVSDATVVYSPKRRIQILPTARDPLKNDEKAFVCQWKH
jgi:hypothetical protein